jgi:hypothetical protein
VKVTVIGAPVHSSVAAERFHLQDNHQKLILLIPTAPNEFLAVFKSGDLSN